MDNRVKISEVLLTLSRVWLFFALGMLALYFIVLAIEQSKTSVYIWGVKPQKRSYRVPIEKEEETDGDSGPDN